jgi:hypothetical protein
VLLQREDRQNLQRGYPDLGIIVIEGIQQSLMRQINLAFKDPVECFDRITPANESPSGAPWQLQAIRLASGQWQNLVNRNSLPQAGTGEEPADVNMAIKSLPPDWSARAWVTRDVFPRHLRLGPRNAPPLLNGMQYRA